MRSIIYTFDILEIEIFVKLIQLHLTHLQIKFRQRMKNNSMTLSYLNLVTKSKVVWRFDAINANDESRRRRTKKQKWSTKLVKKMRKKNKVNKMSIKKRDINFFESNNNKHETLIKLKIDVAFMKRWKRILQMRNWNYIKF